MLVYMSLYLSHCRVAATLSRCFCLALIFCLGTGNMQCRQGLCDVQPYAATCCIYIGELSIVIGISPSPLPPPKIPVILHWTPSLPLTPPLLRARYLRADDVCDQRED